MDPAVTSLRLLLATPRNPGAIAVLQVVGGDPTSTLHRLTGLAEWSVGHMRHCALANIDDGLVGRIAPDVAQITPHGGPRVLQRLAALLHTWGVPAVDPASIDPALVFPEARDRVEAITLCALAAAASPLAIDVLLEQSCRWRDALGTGSSPMTIDASAGALLDRLLAPARVVVAGEPNVGKSTLSNTLMGRTLAIAADMPGTTRDYVAGRIDLAGLVVDWHDTPGLRETDDPVEHRAIDIARKLIAEADCLVAIRDLSRDWPRMSRRADVFVVNKMDDAGVAQAAEAGSSPERPIMISARHGLGLDVFTRVVRERVLPSAALDQKGLWLFDRRLLDTT